MKKFNITVEGDDYIYEKQGGDYAYEAVERFCHEGEHDWEPGFVVIKAQDCDTNEVSEFTVEAYATYEFNVRNKK